MRPEALTLARKEFAGFFASPAAFLFLGAFLGVTYFVFFWVDTFFARGLADVRPLFQWMPLLLVFLVAALTMRSWAEERRAGTLELLLTAPAAPTALVLGKFLGVLALVAVALALTLPLPLSVALLGPLDWGPVVGGYVASLALAAAYVAIGLALSSRTDNQVVSLILTALIGGLWYLIGAPALTALVGNAAGDWLRALGAGSRFASITRGVLDLRDLYYDLSLAAAFLVLNRLSLESLRWAGNPVQPSHRRWQWLAALLVANVLGANLWLASFGFARVDLTQGRIYTLSEATRNYLANLQEPLLIRGYFSASTHPLLAPLVPRLRDLLQEYAVAGGSKVRVEILDPHDDPKIAEEALSRFDVKPVPFQVAGKYQAAVVNSYFDIVVAYGDESEHLGFRDLIDVKSRTEGDFEVALKNPEYDITRAVRKVLASYQGGGSPFAALSRRLSFTGYVSAAASLPPALAPAKKALDDALAKLRREAGDKLQVAFQDPDADPALARRLAAEGLRPMVTGLLEPHPFWFHFTLGDGHQSESVPLPEHLDEAGFRRALEAAVKRFSPGFLKTVAVLTPTPQPGMPGGASFGTLRDALGQSVRWQDTTLEDGRVPDDADLLMVLAPEGLNDRQVFGIDQFLMEGGTVVVATAPTAVEVGQSLSARPVKSGLESWLGALGVGFGKGLVLDPQSGALPVPVERPLGNGMSVREVELVPYAYIVDVRGRGLAADHPASAGLGELQVPWAAPVEVDAKKAAAHPAKTLLASSPASWVAAGNDLLPDFRRHPDLGFEPVGARAAQPLAVVLEGRFDSAWAGKPSPLLAAAAAAPASAAASAPAAPVLGRVIDHSPGAARLVVVGSNALFGDAAIGLVGQARGQRDLKAAQFAQNIADWALEDPGLLAMRSRDSFARTLVPLTRQAQTAWEYANYAVALGALALIAWWARRRRGATARRYQPLLQGA